MSPANPGASEHQGRAAQWLAGVQGQVESGLAELLSIPDELALDPRWLAAQVHVRAFSLRRAKRLRPALLLAGYQLAGQAPDRRFWSFAAGMELLHTFLLIHDDVADAAQVRRGAPALHHLLGPGKLGEDLAVVAGDHLFARSLEALLGAGLPRGAQVTRYMLGICRHTAVGQHLDLELSRAPLAEVTLWQTLKVAHLKTARYGFIAPLVAGAMLGGGGARLAETLDRVGRHLGLAYQLRDDLIGVFGDPGVTGKSSESDLLEGKRTFPVIAAYTRADEAGRKALSSLWDGGAIPPARLPEARAGIERYGGHAATVRMVARATRAARRTLHSLPSSELTGLLDALIQSLEARQH